LPCDELLYQGIQVIEDLIGVKRRRAGTGAEPLLCRCSADEAGRFMACAPSSCAEEGNKGVGSLFRKAQPRQPPTVSELASHISSLVS
jgi:hypothetical protein